MKRFMILIAFMCYVLSASAQVTINVRGRTIVVPAVAQGDSVRWATNTMLDAKAHKTVTITAGSGLSGGGDLSTNRTLAFDSVNALAFVKGQIAGKLSFVGGAMVCHVYQQSIKTDIGTSYVDMYTTAFADEDACIISFAGYDSCRIVWTYDYVSGATANHQARWVMVSDNTKILYESATFKADQDATDTGWFVLPAAFVDATAAIEWQAKSATSTDDPIGYGYSISLR